MARLPASPSPAKSRSGGMSSRKLGSASILALALSIFPGATARCEQVKVVASFSIIGDLARTVGGERVAVSTIVGPNGDAHTYEPRPRDARALATADVILMNGLHFDSFIERLIRASGSRALVIPLSRGADLLHDPDGGHWHHYAGRSVFHQGEHDPHAWQSIRNALVYVANITHAFCARDLVHCDSYRANAAAYSEELRALDAEIRKQLQQIPEGRRTVATSHGAFRYFESEYGVRFVAPAGVSTSAEPSAADVARIIKQIRSNEISAIFVENMTDPRLMQRIASEAGARIAGTLYSDALSEAEGPASSYLALMRHNAMTIVEALRVRPPNPPATDRRDP